MRTRMSVVIGGVAVLGVAVGGVAGAAIAQLDRSTDGGSRTVAAVPLDDPHAAPPSYQVNEAGQTLGSLADATGTDDAPDLVAVAMDDGTTAYIRSAELFEVEGSNEDPSSPAEALALQDARDANGPVELTAYASDGVTVVGTWTALTGL